MPLKIVTLNVGRGFPCWDKTLAFLSQPQWDIACLQDVRETHLKQLENRFPMAQYFAPTARHWIEREWVPVGIGIFSRILPFVSVAAHAYAGQVLPVLNLDGVDIADNGNARPQDLGRFRETQSCIVMFVEVEVGGRLYKIGTTHGPWVPHGVPDDYQRRAIMQLVGVMNEQGRLVIAGDFNASRVGQNDAYNLFIKGTSCLEDCVPFTTANSIDWKMRGKVSGPNVLVDYLFASRDYAVNGVEVHFGVSDHAALSATVSKAN